MRRLLACFVSAIVMTGCATTPTPVSEAKKAEPSRLLAFQERSEATTASVVVIRDSGHMGGGCYSAFWINGQLAARLDVAETATFHIEPGEHRMKLSPDPMGRGLCAVGSDWHWTQRETILRSGERKLFRLSLDDNGKPDIQRAE